MAGSASNYLENKLLDHALRNTAFTQPAALYLALYTSNPTDADSGAEVSGGSYARQAIAFNAAASGATENTSDVNFPEATGAWGTITHWGVRDANAAGNLLFYGDFNTSKAITTGDALTVRAGDIDISAD